MIDTAGLDEGARGSLAARMREQTEMEISGADALLFMVDARAGLIPQDRIFADLVRKSGKPIVGIRTASHGFQKWL